MKNQIPEIGTYFSRTDATAKVTGAEKYATDHYPANLLWAGVKRAGVPHGLIKQIHTSDAENIPGVYAILTRKDVPGSNRQGPVYKDQPVLAGRKVRHCGEPVALVLCECRDILEKALAMIYADIEPLPGIFDMDAALQENSPLIHETGNILRKAVIRKGKALEAMAECDMAAEEWFETPMQEHAFLETENGVAWQESDGTIVMIVATQAPHEDRFEISHALGTDPARIRVISPYSGGGFGGKEGATVQCLLALAALRSNGRPVKMWWSREESFVAGTKRHPARIWCRLGAMKDGTLHALHCRLYYDTGAYAQFGEDVMAVGMEHAGGAYHIPHALIEGQSVYTNNPVASAMRGFGVTQANYALERMIDILASDLGIDPLKFRINNALTRGDKNASGTVITHSAGAKECFEQICRHPLWIHQKKWKSQARLFKRRGVGIAGMCHSTGYGAGFPDSAIAKAELTENGHIRIYSGIPDMGQGNASTLVQIAGEILCQETSEMELVQPDTDKTLPSGAASACRTTFTYGNAMIKACQELRRRLIHRAALMIFADSTTDLEILPGRIVQMSTGKDATLKELASIMPYSERVCIHHYMMPVIKKDHARNNENDIPGIPHMIFCYGAHLVYAEIDELTGSVEIIRYLAATDAGRIINPQVYEQQIHGAVAQGIGFAVSESVVLRNGEILNPNFTDYIIPGPSDIPDIEVVPVQTMENSGPFGMKGVGQIATDGPLPAITNAVADACGINITHAPITGESVMGFRDLGI